MSDSCEEGWTSGGSGSSGAESGGNGSRDPATAATAVAVAAGQQSSNIVDAASLAVLGDRIRYRRRRHKASSGGPGAGTPGPAGGGRSTWVQRVERGERDWRGASWDPAAIPAPPPHPTTAPHCTQLHCMRSEAGTCSTLTLTLRQAGRHLHSRGSGLQALHPANHSFITLHHTALFSLLQGPDSPVKATDFGLSIRHRPEDPPLKSRSGTPAYMVSPPAAPAGWRRRCGWSGACKHRLPCLCSSGVHVQASNKPQRLILTRLLACPFPPRLWQAPEVIQQSYNEAADVWSAGIMMYQLLTGRFPFWDNVKDCTLQQVGGSRAGGRVFWPAPVAGASEGVLWSPL